MESEEAKRWLKSIIKQMMLIERNHCGHRNSALMQSICDRLNRQLQAYPYRGSKILSFIRFHYTDILLIIPGNKHEAENLKKLNSICLQVWTTELQQSTTQVQSAKQLQLFS